MHDFNYLITVHNKEALLAEVLAGVARCAGKSARIVVVLDGCTDGSEKIAREFARPSPVECRILTAPDVHEIKSINIGLRETKPGYCVILQDDVVLQQPDLESLVHELCEKHQRRLGYISFRMAADLRPYSLVTRLSGCLKYSPVHFFNPVAQEYNYVGAEHEHGEMEKAPYLEFRERMMGVKSPICITPELRARAPFLDEDFAPYCYDDVDHSLRAIKAGLVNGLFPIHFQSDLDWGGTRQDPNFSGGFGAGVRLRNRRLIWKKHGALIKRLARHARP